MSNNKNWPKMPQKKVLELVDEFGEFINDLDDLGEEIVFDSLRGLMRFVAAVERHTLDGAAKIGDNKDFPDHVYLDMPLDDSGYGTAFSAELLGKNSVQYTRSDLTLSQDEMRKVLEHLNKVDRLLCDYEHSKSGGDDEFNIEFDILNGRSAIDLLEGKLK